MSVITLYQRADQQTVNTITGYQLTSSQSADVNTYWLSSAFGDANVDINWDVDVIHSNGSNTSLGSSVANYHNPGSNGQFSATWSCPGTSLVTTDAIRVIGRITTIDQSITRIFISNQLGWSQLNAVTWTFYFFFAKSYIGSNWHNRVYHGDATRNTRIEGIDYTLAPTTSIKNYSGVAQASLKKVFSVEIASINKIMGVA